MPRPSDNESWIVETGDIVIQKKALKGLNRLTRWEHLVYCLWAADYGIRNAGDLETARDVYREFQSEGSRIAGELSLPLTLRAFSMPSEELQLCYFKQFEAICDEIRNAHPKNSKQRTDE